MHVTLRKGEADIVEIDDDAVVLRSTEPAPPGARIEGKLATGELVRFKSHGSHREADGTFTIKGRVLDAPRALRETLASLAAARTAG